MKKLISVGVILSLLLLLFTSCNPEPEILAESFSEYFNTESTVISFAGDTKENFDKVKEKVDTLLSEYHKLYDIYYEYSGINNIKTINDNAGKEPVEVDQRIIDLLLFSKDMYELTDGECNVAMGAVLYHWRKANRKSEDGSYTLPDPTELILASSHTDINAVVIDDEKNTVYLTDSEMSLDVGAIAKGFATDRIATALMADKSLATDGYALNIGGNIRLLGSKGGEGTEWRIGITHPYKNSENPYIAIVEVSGTSVVTSGDYEKYYEEMYKGR